MPADDVDLLAALESTPEQERIAAVLPDLALIIRYCRGEHFHGCLCGALAARVRRTLTEEVP